jgi:hypothetical protein
MGAISTDFLDADPNADPPAPDLNAIVDPLNPMLDPNPVALPSPDVEVVEKVNEKITAGRSAWELFKLVKSNKEIHMSGAVFKVTSNTRPNPFSVIKSDIPNFKCPTL